MRSRPLRESLSAAPAPFEPSRTASCLHAYATRKTGVSVEPARTSASAAR
ncbi:hypothetical protein ACFPRL_34910 [Pseudoclavibacter helvolus]